MRPHPLRLFLILSALLLTLSLGGGHLQAGSDSRVDARVLAEIESRGVADSLILLSPRPDLSPAKRLTSKNARGRWVYNTLRDAARQSQSDLIAQLDHAGVPYQRFWLVNAVRAELDAGALQRVLALPDVKRVQANVDIPGLEPLPDTADITAQTQDNITWGVNRVEAPWAWEQGITGEGIVISGQDTGYDFNHPALYRAYRGYDAATDTFDHNYNWHDSIHEDLPPTTGNPCGYDSPVPCDDHGHGTHTMGTMAGNDLERDDPLWPAGADRAVGVAPGASWIGCRNMDAGVGRPSTYIECYEWLTAPYPLGGDPFVDGDPDKSPDVINNSWACPPSEGCTSDLLDIIEPAVDAADAAGIVVVTSAGNAGAACSSIRNPSAIYPKAFAVGATYSSDVLAGFSSRGPVTYGGETFIKPDVAAPGVGVLSSVPPDAYGNKSGTSMAAPHVAGVIALLLSADPTLRGDTELIKAIVKRTADAVPDLGCGGYEDGVPNNRYGWGIANARRAIESLSQEAILDGRISSDRGGPVAGAVVEVWDQEGRLVDATTSNQAGDYALNLPWGSYTLVARLGSKETTTAPVILVGGQTTVQDVALALEPVFLPLILH